MTKIGLWNIVQNPVKIAKTDAEILACYPVMAELRPHITTGQSFLAQVRKQETGTGFRLIYLSDGEVLAVAGIRIAEWLAGGKYLEIEDLVTAETARSSGHGGRLFDWIVDYARAEGCNQVKLVSSVKRFDAHRFYLNKRMIIEAHYFSMAL
jgi:GNAT superfamily N-acetyltransferase